MAFKIETLLIGIIVFAIFIVSGTLMIADINTNYNITIGNDEDFNSTYALSNRMLSETNATTQNMKEKMLDSDVSTTDTISSMLKGGFSAIRLVKNSFGLVYSLLNNIAIALSIPTFFVGAAFTIMIILVVFSIIYLVMIGRTG